MGDARTHEYSCVLRAVNSSDGMTADFSYFNKEFLEETRIKTLLSKYNKFMPVPIKFGTKEETLPLPKNAKKDGLMSNKN